MTKHDGGTVGKVDMTLTVEVTADGAFVASYTTATKQDSRTNADGTSVETEAYSSEDLMASVCQALDISLQTTFTTPSGRPIKIAGGGRVITDLFS